MRRASRVSSRMSAAWILSQEDSASVVSPGLLVSLVDIYKVS